jgi:hypothetical protein
VQLSRLTSFEDQLAAQQDPYALWSAIARARGPSFLLTVLAEPKPIPQIDYNHIF